VVFIHKIFTDFLVSSILRTSQSAFGPVKMAKGQIIQVFGLLWNLKIPSENPMEELCSNSSMNDHFKPVNTRAMKNNSFTNSIAASVFRETYLSKVKNKLGKYTKDESAVEWVLKRLRYHLDAELTEGEREEKGNNKKYIDEQISSIYKEWQKEKPSLYDRLRINEPRAVDELQKACSVVTKQSFKKFKGINSDLIDDLVNGSLHITLQKVRESEVRIEDKDLTKYYKVTFKNLVRDEAQKATGYRSATKKRGYVSLNDAPATYRKVERVLSSRSEPSGAEETEVEREEILKIISEKVQQWSNSLSTPQRLLVHLELLPLLEVGQACNKMSVKEKRKVAGYASESAYTTAKNRLFTELRKSKELRLLYRIFLDPDLRA
jgi:hypothetical protein